MNEYKNILLYELRYVLYFMPHLIVGLVLLVISIIIFTRSIKYKKIKNSLLKVVFIFVISIVLTNLFIRQAGVICLKIYLDYKNSSFSCYEGYIKDTHDSNSLIDKTVKIDYIDFIVSGEILNDMRQNAGEYCKVTFGTRSKYVVDYDINDD